MYELVNIEVKDGKQLVSARELHEYLEVKTRFSLWIDQYVKSDNKYGFKEHVDFTSVVITTVVNNGAKKELKDYALTVDMAKAAKGLEIDSSKIEKVIDLEKYRTNSK